MGDPARYDIRHRTSTMPRSRRHSSMPTSSSCPIRGVAERGAERGGGIRQADARHRRRRAGQHGQGGSNRPRRPARRSRSPRAGDPVIVGTARAAGRASGGTRSPGRTAPIHPRRSAPRPPSSTATSCARRGNDRSIEPDRGAALLPGGREHGGGIGRLVGYVVDAAAGRGARHAVCDTRGPRWSPSSLLRLGAAAGVMVWDRAIAPERVHHIHVAGRGSTLRKLLLCRARARDRLQARAASA